MRVIFVTSSSAVDPRGGRTMLAQTHRKLLGQLLGEQLADHPLRSSGGLVARLAGYIDGASPANLAELIVSIDRHRADTLWLDGSNLGRLALGVKRARPGVRIITFFHNVEARFFWGALRARRSLKSAAVFFANFIAERMAVRHSDTLVTLSTRDSAGLRRLYGRAADATLPIVLEDRAPASPPAPASPDRYVLFVGGGFYANIAGIRWFARDVSPRINLAVKVVGRAMEGLTDELAALPSADLVGAVDDLAPWYAGAAVVVAPIFDGSGMKTKVAEALMHGKHVVGTPEAFSGYAEDIVAANWVCSDADAFVAAIRRSCELPLPVWDGEMRVFYERDHSPAAVQARLAALLGRANA